MNAEIFNHILQYSLIILTTLAAGLFFYHRRQWVALAIAGGLLVRLGVAIVISNGLQYYFVLDSMKYQQNAWLLAQNWITPDLYHALAGANQGARFNLYELFLADFFRVFGYDPLLATFFNSLFSCATVWLIYRIHKDFMADAGAEQRVLSPSFFTALLLGLYPSFVMWSATNVRDPMYFLACVAFFYFFFTALSRRSEVTGPMRLFSLVLCAVCYWTVGELRGYISSIFWASIAGGVALSMLSYRVSVRKLAAGTVFFGVAAAYAYETLLPKDASDLFQLLAQVRLSFANLDTYDSAAKSSFALEQSFRSMTDVFAFFPTGLGHYFFGPYLWEIGSWVQSLALIEAALVMLLTYPTLKGILIGYRRARFETVILLTFVAAFALSQCLAISNMGTIFRHRTLGFLFLAIFTGEGIYEIGKKNYPALFQT